MQQGSLIRSGRNAVQMFGSSGGRTEDQEKRIYRRRVIGTVCQYADAETARKSVAGLLSEINTNGLRRCVLPMTIAECDSNDIEAYGRHCKSLEVHHRHRYCVSHVKKCFNSILEGFHKTVPDRRVISGSSATQPELISGSVAARLFRSLARSYQEGA